MAGRIQLCVPVYLRLAVTHDDKHTALPFFVIYVTVFDSRSGHCRFFLKICGSGKRSAPTHSISFLGSNRGPGSDDKAAAQPNYKHGLS